MPLQWIDQLIPRVIGRVIVLLTLPLHTCTDLADGALLPALKLGSNRIPDQQQPQVLSYRRPNQMLIVIHRTPTALLPSMPVKYQSLPCLCLLLPTVLHLLQNAPRITLKIRKTMGHPLNSS